MDETLALVKRAAKLLGLSLREYTDAHGRDRRFSYARHPRHYGYITAPFQTSYWSAIFTTAQSTTGNWPSPEPPPAATPPPPPTGHHP